jgi:hypothetical protein
LEAAPDPSVAVKGVHGLDNDHPDMKTFLIARGPAFKSGVTLNISDFSVLDVFPLVSTVLGIPLRPNNGSLDRATQLLAKQTLTNSKAMTAIVGNCPSFPTTICFPAVKQICYS